MGVDGLRRFRGPYFCGGETGVLRHRAAAKVGDCCGHRSIEDCSDRKSEGGEKEIGGHEGTPKGGRSRGKEKDDCDESESCCCQAACEEKECSPKGVGGQES